LNDTNTILLFPAMTPGMLLGLVVVFIGLVALAVVIEYWRRGRARAQREALEWKTAQEIAQENGIPDEEWRMFQPVLMRWCEGFPLRTVTTRQYFDDCVQSEMNRLMIHANSEEFDRVGAFLRTIRVRLGLDYIPFGQRIHSTKELYTGQAIWLTDSRGHHEWVKFVVRAVDEATFVASPEVKLEYRTAGLEVGGTAKCRMWREDDARYAFMVPVKRLNDAKQQVAFGHTATLERKQARAHFRVRYEQSAVVGILNMAVDGDTSDLHERPIVTKLTGRITSLSAGGLALIVQQALPRQVLLRITLNLPESDPLQVEAEIVGTSELSGGRRLVRAAYVGVDDETRDTIARYVLRRQQPLVGSSHSEE